MAAKNKVDDINDWHCIYEGRKISCLEVSEILNYKYVYWAKCNIENGEDATELINRKIEGKKSNLTTKHKINVKLNNTRKKLEKKTSFAICSRRVNAK